MADHFCEQQLKQSASQRKAAGVVDPVERLMLSLFKSKGVNGIATLGRKFRIWDDDGNRQLSKEEFVKGMVELGIDRFPEKDIIEVFDKFDKDGSGYLNFDEFLIAIRPRMNKKREGRVREVFDRISGGDDVITVEDLAESYKADFHPKYQNGEWSKKDVILNFLKTFEAEKSQDGKVYFEEFLNYYAGVSASIDDDAYFDLMMRNCWKQYNLK